MKSLKCYLSVFFSLLLFGCVSKEPRKINSEKPLILVSLPPYTTLLREIGGEQIDIFTVIPAGVDPHSYEMTPRQMEKMSKASVWFWTGDPQEKKMVETISHLYPNLILINLSQSIPLLSYADDTIFLSQHSGDHSHEGIDYHIWMSPIYLSYQAKKIYHTLHDLLQDPSSLKIQYEHLQRELTEMHERYTHALLPYRDQSILSSHPAYGYFCSTYGLRQITLESEGKEANAKDITRAIHSLDRDEIRAVITQPQHNTKAAYLLGDYLKKPVYSIDPYATDYRKTFHSLVQAVENRHQEEIHE